MTERTIEELEAEISYMGVRLWFNNLELEAKKRGLSSIDALLKEMESEVWG